MPATIADRASLHANAVRQFVLDDFEFRDDGDAGFTFEGVASVVDAPYSVRDMFGDFTETIKAGAFNKTLRDGKADVALFVSHQSSAPPLATRSAKTLTLAADPNLRVTANLDPARPDVQIIRSAVTRGEMRQMSIGFSVPKARDKWNDDMTVREIAEVNLGETSIVWRGANHLTSGSMRALNDLLSADTADWSEDEVRRAIAYLETLIRSDDTTAIPAEDVQRYSERDRDDLAALELLMCDALRVA